MKKSFYIFLILFISLLGSGLYLNYSQTKELVLSRYAQTISERLKKDYNQVLIELSSPNFIQTSYDTKKNNTAFHKRLYTRPYTLLAYEDDTIVQWYNNKLFLTEELLQSLPESEGSFFIKTTNACVYLVKKNFPSKNGNTRFGIGLIPIKYAYNIDKLIGSNTFQADANIPVNVLISTTKNSHIIEGPAGGQQFLTATTAFKDTLTQKKLVLIFGFSFLLFLLLSNKVANKLSEIDPTHGTFFLTAILSMVLLAISFIDPASKLGGLGNLAETLKLEVMGSSLIVVFFYAISFVWLMVYLNKTYVFKQIINLNRWTKYFISTLLNISLMAGIIVVLEIYKQIIVWSKIDISFLSLLQRKLDSFLGLSVMLISLAAMILLALWLIKFIKALNLTRLERAITISVGFITVLTFLILAGSPHNGNLWYGTAILLPFALDYISERPKREPYAIYTWFGLIAIFASASLYIFQNERGLMEMSSYAKILSVERDTTAESSIFRITEAIAIDSNWQKAYQEDFLSYDHKKAGLLILNHFEKAKYLSYNYTYNFYLYADLDESSTNSALLDQGLSKEKYNRIVNSSRKIDGQNLYLKNTANGSYSYYSETEIKSPKNTTLVLEIKSETSVNENINSPIFSSYDDLARMRNIDLYKYATFKNKNCIRYKGDLQNSLVSLKRIPKKGDKLTFKDKNNINLVYHSSNGNIVILQKEFKGFYQWTSLFAMLFFLISILAAILSLIDKIFRIVPDGLNIKLLPGNTFYEKLQSGFLLLIYISFIAIGGVTAAHFHDSNNNYHDGRLSRKSKTIHTDIGFEIGNLPPSTSIDSIQKRLKEKIVPLSKTHKMDAINFFGPKGKLVFSSKDEIYLKGVTPRKMNASTFGYLSDENSGLKIHPEQLGDVQFKSSYFSILHYGKLVGYLGIPYYTKEQARLSDLNDFVNRLLITYIILFIMAIRFIVRGTKLLAGPIKKLSEGVKSNKEIEWHQNDEFKGLVDAFNESLRAKDIQHQLQVKIEKERVWRDMAKQVAHDIRNPLTPIQLHIQHFQKSIMDRRMDMDQIEERTDRLTTIILTQIKKLLRTVQSFQDLSNATEVSKENVSFNSLLSDIAQLHEKETNIEILLNLPAEEIFVHGNKGQMERVFANIVKNAIQAIPEDKNGLIIVQLSIEGDLAFIKIADNGSGIPDHMTDKIFTPNFTTKSSGTGLGLHICKTILESHSGTIDFTTERGKGTTFIIQLKASRIMSHLNEPTH